MSNVKPPVDSGESIRCALAGADRIDYGDAYRTHLLEQYKAYLAAADKISDRRMTANTFFLTLNTGILSALGFGKFSSDEMTSNTVVAVGIAALPLCYSWYRLVRSYRGLNSAKFKVVHEIESMLPIRPFDAEWNALGRGERSDLYLPFTHIEQIVPWIYFAMYLLLMIIALY